MIEKFHQLPPIDTSKEDEVQPTQSRHKAEVLRRYKNFILGGAAVSLAALLITFFQEPTPTPPLQQTPQPELTLPNTPEPEATATATPEPTPYQSRILSEEVIPLEVTSFEVLQIPPESELIEDSEPPTLLLPDGRKVELRYTGNDAQYYSGLNLITEIRAGRLKVLITGDTIKQVTFDVPQVQADGTTVAFQPERQDTRETEGTAIFAFPYTKWTEKDGKWEEHYATYLPVEYYEDVFAIPEYFYFSQELHPGSFNNDNLGPDYLNSLDIFSPDALKKQEPQTRTITGTFIYLGNSPYGHDWEFQHHFLDPRTGIEYHLVMDDSAQVITEDTKSLDVGKQYQLEVKHTAYTVVVNSVPIQESEGFRLHKLTSVQLLGVNSVSAHPATSGTTP